MKALSVRAIWAWAIIYGGKDIENRPYRIKYRGELLIHSGQQLTKKEYQEAKEFCGSMNVIVPDLKCLSRGKIIGIVEVVGCSEFSTERIGWGIAEQYHWKLSNPRSITPIPYIGQLGLFNVPDELISA